MSSIIPLPSPVPIRAFIGGRPRTAEESEAEVGVRGRSPPLPTISTCILTIWTCILTISTCKGYIGLCLDLKDVYLSTFNKPKPF